MSTSSSFQALNAPQMQTGEYTVTVTQSIDATLPGDSTQSSLDSFTQTQSLQVAGIRFTLPGTAIVAQYPPSGNQGVFANVLPHVVLADPTLPWQNDPGSDAENSPWLALFVVDETDPAPPIVATTVGSLVPSDSSIFFPTLDPAPGDLYGESATDPVNVINVPVALFYALAPSLADLPWLAHVRQTDVTGKATKNGQAQAGTVSVVVGNRFPASEARTTVHLVSLEGYGPYLPNDDGSAAQAFPDGTTTVQLVSLYSWIFQSNSETQSFSDLLNNVTNFPFQRPYAIPSAPSSADQVVLDAFAFGYTALTHTLLTGEQTGSWYRGPLLPYGVTNFTTPPFVSPDQLLRYDPTTGMFDTSYAAAWQLGKLAALHDNTFLAALMRWKRKRTAQAVLDFENSLLDGQLGQSHSTALERFKTIAETVLKPAAESLLAKCNSNA